MAWNKRGVKTEALEMLAREDFSGGLALKQFESGLRIMKFEPGDRAHHKIEKAPAYSRFFFDSADGRRPRPVEARRHVRG